MKTHILLIVAVTLGLLAGTVHSEPTALFKTKDIKLRVNLAAPPTTMSGMGAILHNAWFAPATAHDSTLTNVVFPISITRTVGLGPTTVTGPPTGTYHTGGVAFTAYMLDPINWNATTMEAVITGYLKWGQEAPTPDLLHAELIGGMATSSKLVATGVGTAVKGKFRLDIRADDGRTGGTYDTATDTDAIKLYVNDQLLLNSTTVMSAVGGSYVDLGPSGLRLSAPTSELASITWTLEDLVGSASAVYSAGLAGGVWNVSGPWAGAAWQLTPGGAGHVEAFLPASEIPSIAWESIEYDETLQWEYRREGFGEVTKDVPEPATLSLLALAPLAVMRRRRK